MTTISSWYQPHEIDVRCTAVLPGMTGTEGRCQLFAGHDGPHAVMFALRGERMVRTWPGRSAASAFVSRSDELQRRPWMYGFPLPAWFEGATKQAG